MDKHPEFIKLKTESGTSESIHYSMICRHVPKEFQTIAEKELNETEESKKKGLQQLRKYLKRENIPDVDDWTLIIVLRSCKYNIKKSEAKLKKYLAFRTIIYKKLVQTDAGKVERILKDMFTIGFLPYRDKDGRAIGFTRIKINPGFYTSEEAILTSTYFLIFILQNVPMISLTGIVYIADSKCYPGASTYESLMAFAKLVPSLLDLPLRIAKIEVTNSHVFSRLCYHAVLPFLSHKLRERIYFHREDDFSNMLRWYHPALLPEEFGGSAGPINSKFYSSEIQEMMNFYNELKLKYKE